MKILLIVLGVITVTATVIWGVDYWHYLVDCCCRFHIGKWSDLKKWENAVIKKAIRWSIKTPTVKITDNNRYLLLDMIQGKYRSHTIQSWQTGAIILGLSNINTQKCNTAVQNACSRFIAKGGGFIQKPTNVDCGLLAYAILKTSNPQQVKQAMDYAVDLILNHIASDGMISYVNDLRSDERYVDTLGLTCPFLAYYASIYDKPECARVAVEQIKQFSQYGLETVSLLPNHAYSTSSKLPLGVYGWGRGTGWYVLGLIDTFKEIHDCEDKIWIKNQIKRIADSYRLFQRDDGGFGYIMQMQYGYDSSTTAIMAYFYRECSRIFNDNCYQEIANRAMDKLRSVTRMTGAIDWCQGDTKGIGVFSQTYNIMPFAQGMVLRTIQKE